MGMSTKNIFLFPFKPYHCSHCQNTPISFCYLPLDIYCPKKLGALVQKKREKRKKEKVSCPSLPKSLKERSTLQRVIL